MARKGSVIWHAVRRGTVESLGEVVITEKHVALRTDGKLIKRLVIGHPDKADGRSVRRNDYGWKLAKARTPEMMLKLNTIEGAKEILVPKGYAFKKL